MTFASSLWFAVLDTGERSLGAAGCDATRVAWRSYEAHADCPAGQRPVMRDPAHEVAFTPACEVWLPPRACAAPIPANYAAPDGERRGAHRDQRRLFAPIAGAVDWARYPDYPQNELKPEWGAAGQRGPGGAGKTDCYKCFSFAADRAAWTQYVRTFLLKAVPQLGGDGVRTMLDIGAGAGGLLATLQDMFPGLQGIGVTRDGPTSPYLATMAARGVLGLQASSATRLPFGDNAFDLVHSHLAGLRFSSARADKTEGTAATTNPSSPSRAAAVTSLDLQVYEWDRLVRPGGFLVQTGWKLRRGAEMWNRTAARFMALTERLGWRTVVFTREGGVINYVGRKPESPSERRGSQGDRERLGLVQQARRGSRRSTGD